RQLVRAVAHAVDAERQDVDVVLLPGDLRQVWRHAGLVGRRDTRAGDDGPHYEERDPSSCHRSPPGGDPRPGRRAKAIAGQGAATPSAASGSGSSTKMNRGRKRRTSTGMMLSAARQDTTMAAGMRVPNRRMPRYGDQAMQANPAAMLEPTKSTARPDAWRATAPACASVT